MPGLSGRRHLWLVAGLLFAWFAATAWVRPLMLPDEGRYVGVAWEMLRSGEWLTPTLDGLPFFHKPPLFYWITAGSLSVFGLHELAGRAAPLLGAWCGGFGLYLFLLRWADRRTAMLALVALAAQPLFYLGGQFANLDMLVAGCITVTVLLFAHSALLVQAGREHRWALAAAYAAAAVGVLAKGLIGFVIPALVVVCWLLLLRRWRAMRALFWLPGALVFLAIAGPWFVAMQRRYPGFLDYFFVVQHFQRFAAGGFNNARAFWFYPAVLLLLSLPSLPWLWHAFRRRFGSAAPTGGEAGAVRSLMVVWVSAVVLFFSLPESKLLGYVLPALPPLAFLIAEGLSSFENPSARVRRGWWASAVAGAAVGIGVLVALSIHPARSTRDIAVELARQRGPHDAVFMLENYYYDLGFYAGLRTAVGVVDAWDSPEIRSRDNWRKELVEAADFATPGAAARLVTPASWPAALCSADIAWVVGPADAAARQPLLTKAARMADHQGVALWKIDARAASASGALNCGEKSRSGSANG